jgi:hypothetical protein
VDATDGDAVKAFFAESEELCPATAAFGSNLNLLRGELVAGVPG